MMAYGRIAEPVFSPLGVVLVFIPPVQDYLSIFMA
jgi:hypothetical protein